MNDNRCNRVWPRAATTAARRAGSRAASAPARYPFFSRRPRVRLPAVPLQQQKAVGQKGQAHVVVEAAPAPPLEVVQPQLLFELLVALLHRPAALPQPHRPNATGPRRQVREGVLELAVGLFLALNGRRLVATQADATLTMLAVAAGQMDEAAFSRWLREHSAAR